MKKTHIGSKFDDLLKEDRLLEVATATATKRVIAHQIACFASDRRALTVFCVTSVHFYAAFLFGSQDARAAPADRAARVVPACRVPPRPVRLQPSRTR